ncbi:MAG: hypothetical protein ACOCX1_05450, partial [Fimbriimonadaceae bacterium]
GKGLEWVVKKVPEARVLPVSILYEMGIHERPQAVVHVGLPLENGAELVERTRTRVIEQLELTREDRERVGYVPLVLGTRDVNERWDERRKRPDS